MLTKGRRRRLIRRTVMLERGGRSIKAILLVPASGPHGHDPLLESVGTYADEPLWDDWLTEIAANRQSENKATV